MAVRDGGPQKNGAYAPLNDYHWEIVPGLRRSASPIVPGRALVAPNRGQYTGHPQVPTPETILSDVLKQHLAQLSRADILPLLRFIRRGIEKESLRVSPDGELAQTPHPAALGSALTHPQITTDYSEALLEFITPVATTVAQTLAHLDNVHRFAYGVLQDETIWNTSMPCRLDADQASIPVARYGSANIAQMKTVYRNGLGYRYGRHMQTIAGIHYNFSLPDALWRSLYGPQLPDAELQERITAAYFGLIRNFRRYSWLLVYLFGVSPALSESFLAGRDHRLEHLDDDTLYLPFGTSLRMGDLGYQSHAQDSLNICYNRLDTYVATLKQAILNPHPPYRDIGVLVDGEYRQLSAGLLQIENEFYSTIRPKRVARSGETALSALAHRGVEYIEVRCIDVNPYLPVGIDAELIRFLDAFLVFCLFSDSPACDGDGHREIKQNMRAVVNEGRRPGLNLTRDGSPIALQRWGADLLDAIEQTAALLDAANPEQGFVASCAPQRRKLADPALTPSARLLRDLQDQRSSYLDFALTQSRAQGDHFRSRPLEPQPLAEFIDLAEQSIAGQAALEAADQLPFDTFLHRYFEQYRAL